MFSKYSLTVWSGVLLLLGFFLKTFITHTSLLYLTDLIIVRDIEPGKNVKFSVFVGVNTQPLNGLKYENRNKNKFLKGSMSS